MQVLSRSRRQGLSRNGGLMKTSRRGYRTWTARAASTALANSGQLAGALRPD
jgi:hypothetical protein